MSELARPSGRQAVDPKAMEIARLKRRAARAEAELDKARRVIQIQGKLSALWEQLAADSASTETRGETR
ncbi:hypothetical protein K6U06_14870 [Acidiferrimicrobium sp. IK]|uniref:hypothetical protein n=1 Tax=Acidiferrimicrobium sp. IK TaxID=2871700 RepID=UPI0021CB5F64|nr:hypothetical protein [Acidiferrimicrobium sp. IK]MCU4185648.1 hypothetical protein [Acidiferrimicrobium sp. IK]